MKRSLPGYLAWWSAAATIAGVLLLSLPGCDTMQAQSTGQGAAAAFDKPRQMRPHLTQRSSS